MDAEALSAHKTLARLNRQLRDLSLIDIAIASGCDTAMSDDPLPPNLGYLCSLYPSIAEVCRKLVINRQQFNKYLSGQARPSRHNMRRICDFFGVTESEMLLEPNRFVELVSLRRRPFATAAFKEPLRHIEGLYQQSAALERYLGYYFRYFYSFGYPNHIIKSLAVIHEQDGRYYWKNMEIMRAAVTGQPTTVSKYVGTCFLLSNRIFIVEYEALLRNSITQLTLYPSYHPRVDRLSGIQTGGPVKRGRKPGASKVMLQYLGRHIDVRRALAAADIFLDQDVEPWIREMVSNRIEAGSSVLDVEEL
jgi:transcriptional regulator with XRE-family HTH domain